jgi:hypothetical protein
MDRSGRGFNLWFWGMMALLVLGAGPAFSQAAWLGYRNDTNAPVILQGSSIVNKVPRLGRIHVLYPGEVAWDAVLQAGDKTITIIDGKTRRPLYKGTVNCTSDLFLSIRADGPGRVKLTPTKMPRNRPTPH